MKRHIINTIAVLVITAVAILAIRSYSQSGSALASSQGSSDDQPQVKSKLVATKVEPLKVQAAVVLDKDGSEEEFVADLLSIYSWGRSHFRPYKCGEEYPANLCQFGEVHIVILVTQKDIPSTTGPVEGYMILTDIWLDQVEIDVMFDDPTAVPTSFADLQDFVQKVVERTQGTGGNLGHEDYDQGDIFIRLK